MLTNLNCIHTCWRSTYCSLILLNIFSTIWKNKTIYLFIIHWPIAVCTLSLSLWLWTLIVWMYFNLQILLRWVFPCSLGSSTLVKHKHFLWMCFNFEFGVFYTCFCCDFLVCFRLGTFLWWIPWDYQLLSWSQSF